MKILAIETSCDDTAIAVLQIKSSKFKVLANVVSSQTIHQKYGGVFPMMAKREHQKNLEPVLHKALSQAKLLKEKGLILNGKQKVKIKEILEKENYLFEKVVYFLQKYEKPNIDLIALTNGPGLEPCLWVGINFAKSLSYVWDIPVIPVNHIEAHILVNFLKNENIKFPAMSLVVSGGHTQLILVKGIGKYKIIGETRDDAAGECFDKAAKILGLGYPGGPIISKLASQHPNRTPQHPKLPRPMINTKDYDFSFSGLKTAILYHHKKQTAKTQKSKEYIAQMCAEIQQAIIDVLLKKTIKAARDYKAETIILGGGVSANQELKKQLKEKIQKEFPNTKYLIPNTQLSTDNALMIAITGYYNKNKKVDWKKLEAKANLRIRIRPTD